MKKRDKAKKSKILKFIKSYKHKFLIFFVLIMFILYLSTLSISLDDEDSVHFIRGVKEFNVVNYQPHPPGYPVYIFFGKIALFFMKDELLALTTMSAIFGALSLVVFYFLVLEMFNKKTALMSAIILGVTPLFWLNGLKAMTDMAGLFFVLFSMYFIYYYIKHKNVKSLYIGSFISAIAVGVRFHTLFITVPLLIYAYLKTKDEKDIKNKKERQKRKKNKKRIAYCLIFFILGILIWLIPTLIVNGFVDYFVVCSEQFLIRFKNPQTSTLAGSFSFDYLYSRIGYFIGFFLAEGYGINLWSQNMWQVISLLIFFSFFLLSYKSLKDKQILFFFLGLIFYIIMVLLFLTPHNPRYFLPLIPLISLLFVLGVYKFGKYKNLAFVFLFILLLIHSVPLADKIHTTESAPVQLINYLKENYDLDKILILEDYMTLRHLDYYNITAYPQISLESDFLDNFAFLKRTGFEEETDKEALRTEMRNNLMEFRNKSLKNNQFNEEETRISVFYKNKTVLIINPTQNILKNYNATLIRKFQRDLRVHPKHNTVFLYGIREKLD